MEFDFELPIGDVVDRGIFAVASIVGRVFSVEAGGSVEAVPFGFLLRLHVVCWDEPQVDAKTDGGGYPSERRSITTARRPEVEASFANCAKRKSTKINASVTAQLYSMSHQQQLHKYL